VSALAHSIRRYPIVSFMVLACVVGWSLYGLAAVGVGSHPENLPLGPVVAALVVTSVQGRDALRSWGRRLRGWAASPWLYAVAIGTPILVLVADVFTNSALGAPLPTAAQLADWPQIPINFLVMIVMVGLGEEAGWSAFAAPVLMRRHGLFGAWAIMAPMRIFWHVPLLLSGDMSFPIWLLGNAGFQMIVLLLMSRSNGAWSLAAVAHATQNAFGGAFLFTMFTGADLDRLGALLGVLYGLAGAVAALIALRGRAAAETDTGAAPVQLGEDGTEAGADAERRAVWKSPVSR
jgi:CAAX protease family protein